VFIYSSENLIKISAGSRGGARGARSPPPPLFWVKKEEMTERRKAGRASKTNWAPTLAQSLDPPLKMRFASGQQ